MAFPAKKPKRDFLDDVVEEMGPKNDGDSYGASMDDSPEPAEEDMGDDEEAGEDRVMAAKTLGKALGITNADWNKVDSALSAYVRACMSDEQT